MVIADAQMLLRAAGRLGLPLQIDEQLDMPSLEASHLTVQHVPLFAVEEVGRLDARNARYVINTLEQAASGCLEGLYDAVVTGPVQKSIINEGGISFTGHTEYFCEQAGVEDVVMLLVAGSLRVALATTHLPLSAVPKAITATLLRRRLSILLEGLRSSFGIAQPRVLVAGLNPHAGEAGHLGREEIEVIGPVCQEFRDAGEDVRGPLPADTIFTPAMLSGADVVLAMFHDQGLPVLKYQAFGQAVNVTVGLPFVRTSVDHGTALDLAGSGKADSGSLLAALELAERLSERRVPRQ